MVKHFKQQYSSIKQLVLLKVFGILFIDKLIVFLANLRVVFRGLTIIDTFESFYSEAADELILPKRCFFFSRATFL